MAFSRFWEQMHPNCLVVLLKHQQGTNASATRTSACKTMFLLWHISLRTLFQRLYFIYFVSKFFSLFYKSLFTLTLFTQSFIGLFHNIYSILKFFTDKSSDRDPTTSCKNDETLPRKTTFLASNRSWSQVCKI